ncbi:hypothetical protein [Saliniramus sp.]|uniref:hypothetical protein n=1 Tax=Saliniramus sp. TaxID=2986772 RepID=UPI002BDD24AC|nr:hypothetical protein [Saliniramus sp.]HMB09901.1 hypothetical protein [Saliniramus sp.]
MSNGNDEDKKNNENLNDFLAEGAEERSGENHSLRNAVKEVESEIEKISKKVYYLSAKSNDEKDFSLN